jgi:hypothetical protein
MSTEIKNIEPLTPAEFKDYKFHCDSVRINLQTVSDATEEIGESLGVIKSQRLYRQDYETFAEFVNSEYGKSATWAYQQLEKIRVLTNLKSVDSNLQTEPTVAQSHQLSSLPDEEQADAWAESQEKAESEGREVPTTKDVKETVQKRKAANGGEYKPPKVDKPTRTVPVGPDLAVFDKLFGQAIRKYDECAAHYKWSDKPEHGELLDAAGCISEKYAELVRGLE